MSEQQDPKTHAGESEGSTADVATADVASVDVENELNAVKNFSFIGVCVFLAFLAIMFSFETTVLPLRHKVRSSPDLSADRQQEFDVKFEGWTKARLQSRKAALDSFLARAESVVVASNLGLSVQGSDAGLTINAKPLAGTAAAEAGLQVGDILRQVGGIGVKGPEGFREALEALVGTEDVAFEYLRGGSVGNGSGVYRETYQPLELHHAAEELVATTVEISARHWSVIKLQAENIDALIVKEKAALVKERARALSGTKNEEIIKGIVARLKDFEARFAKRLVTLKQARDEELISATDLIASKYHFSTAVKRLAVLDWKKKSVDGKDIPVVDTDSELTRASLVGGLRLSEDSYWRQRSTGEVEFASWMRYESAAEQKAQTKKHAGYAKAATSIMEEYFGTPDKPVFKGQTEISEATLAQGAAFYREHCAHCHGISGYGDGPTAPFLNPRPRNYTRGKFKLRTNKSPKPSMADLVRTMKTGMQGSMMPPFVLYKDTDLKAAAAYVKYLSVRGETEWLLYNAFSKSYDNDGSKSYLGDWEYNAEGNTLDELVENGETSEAIKRSFPRYLQTVLTKWSGSEAPLTEDQLEAFEALEPKEPKDDAPAAQKKAYAAAAKAHEILAEIYESRQANAIQVEGEPVAPNAPEFAASLRRGAKLFIKNCKECHGWDGTGGGEKSEGMKDEWGLKPEWGYPIQPRNLTRGIYRGGGRPIDIYYRIAGGITGSGMPLSEMSADERWDLVNFIKSLAKTKQLKD